MKYVLMALCLVLLSCKTEPTQPVPVVPVAKEDPQPPKTFPTPIKGWPKEYDEFIVAEVGKYPALLNVTGKRMGSFAPMWDQMDEMQKREWYSHLLYGIAKFESSYDRTSLYFEDKFTEKDNVTKLPVVSEGLTQLSYQDKQWYPFCKFDYAKDKKAFEDDWKSRPTGKLSWKSKHPERTILDPYVNLGCAVGIMDAALRSAKKKNMSFADAMGYWSTMKKHREEIKAIILKR